MFSNLSNTTKKCKQLHTLNRKKKAMTYEQKQTRKRIMHTQIHTIARSRGITGQGLPEPRCKRIKRLYDRPILCANYFKQTKCKAYLLPSHYSPKKIHIKDWTCIFILS